MLSYMWLFAIDWLVGPAIVIIALPWFLVRSGQSVRRWIVRIAGLAAWAVTLHGAQLYAPFVASTLHAPPDFVAHDSAYCSDFDFVLNTPEAQRFSTDVNELGQRWDQPDGLSVQASSLFCDRFCANWMLGGRVRRLFVGAQLELPLVAGQLPKHGLLLVTPTFSADCTRTGFESYARARGPHEHWTDSCFATTEAVPIRPTLATTLLVTSHDVGFGLVRLDYEMRLEELFSHRILSSTHMVQLRHISGALEQFQSQQQITVGALTDPDTIVARYFNQNCVG